MNQKIYNKKILLIIKILLFVLGFLVGFSAIYQVLDLKADWVKSLGLRIVFYIASGIVPAVALMLSSKGFYRILESLGASVMKRANNLKTQDLAAVLLAAVTGALFGYACDLFLGLFLKIFALRLFIDILTGSAVVYFTMLLCFKWFRETEVTDTFLNGGTEEKNEKEEESKKGYLLTYSALQNDKAVTLFSKWLIGEKYILAVTEERLNTQNKDSTVFENYSQLKEGGFLKILPMDIFGETGEDSVKFYAKEHSLKIVVSSLSDAVMFEHEPDISPLIIDEL